PRPSPRFTRSPFPLLAAPVAARCLFTAAALAAGTGVRAQVPAVEATAAACAEEIDDRRRLACYDALFRPGVAVPPAPDQTPPSRNALPALGENEASESPAGQTPVLAGLSLSGSVMSKYWELE